MHTSFRFFLTVIGVILYFHFSYSETIYTKQKLDSLWKVWKDTRQHDTSRLIAIDNYCWNAYVFNQPDSALYYLDFYYQFAKERKLYSYCAEALCMKAVCYDLSYKIDTAILYYQKALSLIDKNKNPKIYAKIINNLGSTEYARYNYLAALKCGFECLAISEENNFSDYIISSHVNIGNIYHQLEDIDAAASHYQKALKILKTAENKHAENSVLSNLGMIYNKKKEYYKSIQYHKKALKISEEINYQYGICNSLLNIGNNYLDLQKYDSALVYFFQSLEIAIQLEDEYMVNANHNNLAEVYKNKNDFVKSEYYAKIALSNAKEFEDYVVLSDASLILSEIYLKDGKYKEALEMYKLHSNSRDTILNEKNKNALIRSQIQYEFDKKAATIKQETKIKSLKLKRRAYIIAVLSLISVLSFIIYYLITKQNKLKTSKKSIELEHKLLGSQMNTHFTFNAINSIQEYILNNQNEKAHYLLSEFSKLMRMVLTHNRKKIIAISDEIELLKKYIFLEEQRIKDKINFTVVNSNQLDLDNVKIPSLLIQPVIENSIWHGLRFRKSTKNIELIFTKENNEILKIEIADNGVGIQDAEKLSLDVSHGLAIVKERIRLLYINEAPLNYFEIKNNTGKDGTTVTIRIPIINEFD
ncbi:MAG TPA: tetratricopeptide repeat protein [Chitinophagales bacterium]|nr:tetratricopeptide repeat protein [Chitinophagales bacterium]